MTTLPEEAVFAAAKAITGPLRDPTEWELTQFNLALTAALPHLPGVGVKAHPNITRPIVGIENRTAQEVFDIMRDRILSALEPSAADMGNPITDKTVKMALAEAIAQVWYQTRDCDVEEIDRIIAHLNRNGLLIVGSLRFRMMADAIQSAAAYLALSQPNSAENLIAELDTALNGETASVNQLFGNSEQLIESLIKDADWLGEYGHQMHEECEYDDGGSTANRLQAIGDRISKLIETVIPVSDEVDSIEVGIPATEPSTASKMEVVAETGIRATEPSAARELALEEAARAAENAVLEYNLSECAGLADWAAFEAGQESGLKHAAAAIRALGTSCEQLNKAVSNVQDQQENEPGAHGERERALEELVRAATSAFNAIQHYAETNVTTIAVSQHLNTAIEAAIRALSSPDHTQCCNGLPPQECADVPSRHCDGMRSGPDHNADAGKLVEGDGRNGRELMRQEVVLMIERFYSDYTWHHQLIANVMALPSAPSQEVAGS